jgi:hypothetical protein
MNVTRMHSQRVSRSGGNDFQVMERGVCLGIRSQDECRSADTVSYCQYGQVAPQLLNSLDSAEQS